jgi:hypothetical protein
MFATLVPLVAIAAIWVAFSAIVGNAARFRGRSAFVWLFVSLIVSPVPAALMLAILPNVAKARDGWEFETIAPATLERCSGRDSRTITRTMVCVRAGRVIKPRHRLARA